MKIIILVVIILINVIAVNSQTVVNLLKNNSITERTSNKTSFLISVKAGYHTAYDKENDAGFNSGLIFSGNADIGLTENIYTGISYEFWNHSGEIVNIDNVKYSRNSTGSNISFNIAWKTNFDPAGIYFGFGIGSYTVKSEWVNNNSSRSYLNFKFLAGLDIKLSKMFLLSTDIAYNAMTKLNTTDKSDKASMFSFKIGPTLILY
jgi:hypothetical protein